MSDSPFLVTTLTVEPHGCIRLGRRVGRAVEWVSWRWQRELQQPACFYTETMHTSGRRSVLSVLLQVGLQPYLKVRATSPSYFNALGARLICVLLFCWALSPTSTFAFQAPDEGGAVARKILEKASATLEAERVRWHEAGGQGVLKYSSALRNVHWTLSVDFERRGEVLWLELNTLEANPASSRMFNRITLIADGESLASARFSPNMRPSGCDAELWEDDPDRFARATRGMEFDPRRFLPSELLPKNPVELYEQHNIAFSALSGLDESPAVVLVQFAQASIRYEFLPKLDYRLHRVAVYFGKAELAAAIYEFDWNSASDDLVSLAAITVKHYRKLATGAEGYNVQTLTLDELRPDCRLVKGGLNLRALDLCGETRLIDRRPEPKARQRDIPRELNTDPNKSIAEQVDELPAKK
jgi:hypothetical protein